MRYLHPIAPHERFIASGLYRPLENDPDRAVIEIWTIHELPDGERFIRIDYTAPTFYVLAEVLARADGTVERIDMRHSATQAAQAGTLIRTTLVLYDDYIQASRRVDDGESIYDEFPRSPDTRLCPPFLLFQGDYRAYGDEPCPILTANLADGMPYRSEYQLVIKGTEVITIGKSDIRAQHLQVWGRSEWFWVDERYIPLKWSKAEAGDRVYIKQLFNYAHR